MLEKLGLSRFLGKISSRFIHIPDQTCQILIQALSGEYLFRIRKNRLKNGHELTGKEQQGPKKAMISTLIPGDQTGRGGQEADARDSAPLSLGTDEIKKILYSRGHRSDGPKQRAAKRRASSEAQKRLNLKNSREKLKLVLAAAFPTAGSGQVFILTYRPDCVPASWDEADERVNEYRKLVRRERRKRRLPFYMVSNTEEHSARHGRLHHHVVVNTTGEDYELLRRCWKWGEVLEFHPMRVDKDQNWKTLAAYMTNLEDPALRVRTAPSLYRAVKAADDENRAAVSKPLPRYEYPDNIITAAMVQRWCKYGVECRLSVQDSRPIDKLEAQKARGLSIYGNGFLLSTRAAAERAAEERWKLCDAERDMVALIDAKCSK